MIVIPARMESERFPGKPLAMINGKPMIYWTYQNCLKSKVKKVMVATHNEEIIKTVKGFGGNVIMTSDKPRTGTDRIAEIADQLDDIVINVQCNEPLMSPENIDMLYDHMTANWSTDVATLKIGTKYPTYNPNTVKVVTDNEGFALYFSRSKIPYGGKMFHKKLGIYAYMKDALLDFPMLKSELAEAENLEQLRFLQNGYKIKVIEAKADSISVHVPDDVKRVEAMMNDKDRKD